MSILRKVLIGIGAVLGAAVLVVGLGIAALFFVDWNAFRDNISGRASEAAGRKVEIRGDLEVVPSWRPQVRARDFVISNPDWASEREMIHVGEIYFQFQLWPLLVGRIELDAMRLAQVKINLEKSKDGKANWHFGRETPAAAAVKVATPQKREEFPVLRRLEIEKGDLAYRAPGQKPIALHIDTLEQTGGGLQDPVSLKLRGAYQGSPLRMDAEFGSFGLLRDGGKPYPVKLNYNLGDVAGAFEGTITEPVDFKGLQGKVSLKGKNLEDLHRLLGLPVAQSPPYEFSGEVSQERDDTFNVRNFAGKLGDSDMRGNISVRTGGERPKLVARLTSNALAMKDIEGFWGAKAEQPGTGSQAPNVAGTGQASAQKAAQEQQRSEQQRQKQEQAQPQKQRPGQRAEQQNPQQRAERQKAEQQRPQQRQQQQQSQQQRPQQNRQQNSNLALSSPNTPQSVNPAANAKPEVPARGGLIPDEPFRLDKLRAMDVDLDFQGKSIKLSGPALNDFKVKLLLENGKLTLKPLELGVFDGHIAANLDLDGSANTPKVGGVLDLKQIKLTTMLAILGIDDKSFGDMFGKANLRTQGNSLHQLAANANGNGVLEMDGGQISALLLELVALRLPEAIGEWLGGSKDMAEISCLLAPFEMRDGVMHANPWLFDTSKALVEVKGYIDLRNERMKLSLKPHPKDFSFFNTLASVEIEGDLAKREANVDYLDVAAKVVLKALLSPFQPLVSPPNEQEARDARPCAKMLEQAKAMAR